MALIIEDGSIVENADSFIAVADAVTIANNLGFLDFADLDTTEEQEPALRVGFNYLATRWESQWRGFRVRPIDTEDGDAVTEDDIAFVAASNEITSTDTDFTDYFDEDTEIIRVEGSESNDGDYHVESVSANSIIVTETTFTDEAAGEDIGLTGYLYAQRGAFPRAYVYTNEGFELEDDEVPYDIKVAQVMYALVAVEQSLNLLPTPAYDDSGRPLTKLEQGVGPLKQTKEWSDSSVAPIAIRKYPQADVWVKRWINDPGTVIR